MNYMSRKIFDVKNKKNCLLKKITKLNDPIHFLNFSYLINA